MDQPTEVANRFKYYAHPQRVGTTVPLIQRLHEEFVGFATYLENMLPDGRHKAMALSSLEESLWAGVAAVLQDMPNAAPVVPALDPAVSGFMGYF